MHARIYKHTRINKHPHFLSYTRRHDTLLHVYLCVYVYAYICYMHTHTHTYDTAYMHTRINKRMLQTRFECMDISKFIQNNICAHAYIYIHARSKTTYSVQPPYLLTQRHGYQDSHMHTYTAHTYAPVINIEDNLHIWPHMVKYEFVVEVRMQRLPQTYNMSKRRQFALSQRIFKREPWFKARFRLHFHGVYYAWKEDLWHGENVCDCVRLHVPMCECACIRVCMHTITNVGAYDLAHCGYMHAYTHI